MTFAELKDALEEFTPTQLEKPVVVCDGKYASHEVLGVGDAGEQMILAAQNLGHVVVADVVYTFENHFKSENSIILRRKT